MAYFFIQVIKTSFSTARFLTSKIHRSRGKRPCWTRRFSIRSRKTNYSSEIKIAALARNRHQNVYWIGSLWNAFHRLFQNLITLILFPGTFKKILILLAVDKRDRRQVAVLPSILINNDGKFAVLAAANPWRQAALKNDSNIKHDFKNRIKTFFIEI